MFAKRQVMLTAVTLALLMNIGVDAHTTAQEAADAIISKVNRASRRLDNHAKTDTACDARGGYLGFLGVPLIPN